MQQCYELCLLSFDVLEFDPSGLLILIFDVYSKYAVLKSLEDMLWHLMKNNLVQSMQI